MKGVFSVLYGLLVIWTGLLRGIEAGAFKPNALFFCLVMGAAAIAAGFLFRFGKNLAAWIAALAAAAIVFSFYFSCFVGQPEKDATHRVALAILASIAYPVALFMLNIRNREKTNVSKEEGAEE